MRRQVRRDSTLTPRNMAAKRSSRLNAECWSSEGRETGTAADKMASKGGHRGTFLVLNSLLLVSLYYSFVRIARNIFGFPRLGNNPAQGSPALAVFLPVGTGVGSEHLLGVVSTSYRIREDYTASP